MADSRIRLSAHAVDEIRRRDLDRATVEAVAANPDQRVPAFGGRTACQSRVTEGDRVYLLRVIVDERVTPAVIVTAYRTSRIEKYWRKT